MPTMKKDGRSASIAQQEKNGTINIHITLRYKLYHHNEQDNN